MIPPASTPARTPPRRRRPGAASTTALGITALGLAVLVAASGCTGDFRGDEAPSAAVPVEQRPLFLPAGNAVSAGRVRASSLYRPATR